MQLRDSVFEAHEIKAMSAAFAKVCEAMNLQDDSSTKQIMAARIIDLVRRGECSPTRLRDRLLREASLAEAALKDVSAVFSGRLSTPAFVGLFTDEVAQLQPRLRLGGYPISCGGTIVEGVDALKGAIRPLSLDCPLIAVTEDNVKDRLLRALGHPDAIPHKNDSLETIR
jgi:hypothetical protein